MKIHTISLERLQIPLTTRFSQANNSTAFSDSMILQLTSENGVIGYGESCPRPYVTGEDASSVQQDIKRIAPVLKQIEFASVEDIRTCIMDRFLQEIGPAACCAIELALLDVLGKMKRQSTLHLLGGTYRDHYQYCGVLPMGSPQTMQKLLLQFKAIGFQEVKLKIGTDLQRSLQAIQMVKQLMGGSTRIRLDVNCAWDLTTAEQQIPDLIEAGAHNFEQIFPADQLTDFQKITAAFGDHTRIAIDEGLNTPRSAIHLIEEKICNQFNLKISKHGGIFSTLAICRIAKEHGIGCQLGAHFGETSLLTSAGLIIASMVEELTSLEGAFGTHLLTHDITDTPLQFGKGGSISHPASILNPTGLGIVVNPANLHNYKT